MKKCSLAFTAMLFLWATEVNAQEIITPGTSIKARITKQSGTVSGLRSWMNALSTRGSTVFAECYFLPTEAGKSYKIEMSIDRFTTTSPGSLLVGIGRDCSEIKTWNMQDDQTTKWSRPKVEFTSTGGVYTFAATSFLAVGAWGNTNPSIPFEITVTETSSGKDALPAGFDIQLIKPPSGTASTFAGPAPQVAPGDVIRDCDNCPEMISLPKGSFMMGSVGTEEGRNGNEGPRHQVSFGRPFAISRTEVTFAQWDACVSEKACSALTDNGWGRGNRPATGISYQEAERYVSWLSDKTGQKYFIPSEAEWEYAARSGSEDAWNTGVAILAEDANILDQFGKTVPVGSYPPNAFGLYDMHGNVSEWVQDCVDTGYLGVPTNGEALKTCSNKDQGITRGGNFRSAPNEVRSASRIINPKNSKDQIGLRITRALQ